MAKQNIHISDVRQFKGCRRKWNWASPLRRNLEPAVPYMPFFTGRAIHHCLENYYRSGTPMLKSLGLFLSNEKQQMGNLWPAEEVKVQEQIDLMIAMLQHYEQWVAHMAIEGSRFNDANLEFIALETEFTVPIRNHRGRKSPKVALSGRMDGVVRLKDDGSVWLWETKTTRSIQELSRSLVNDPQAGAYMLAAMELFDVKPSGVLYNMLRKKAPTVPEVVKGGLLTRRKNIDTTAQAYMASIRELHPDWDQSTILEYYGEILQTLIDEGNQFFARVPIRRTMTELNELAKNLWTVAMEMTDPKIPLYPNESWLNCNFCHFRAPCLAMNAGLDYEFLISQEYQKRAKSVSWRTLEEEE
jgi:hypothetical protein